ncbi:MAG: TetR/AcrR family transcriptional regulator, partial [Actinobacteria bacterium]|nr:TetR/AcrR family transcriptional regulator [Actinomycetota bacterium]
ASGTNAFVERMGQHVATSRTPLDAVVEAIVFCVEELPREPRIGLLLQAEDDLFGRGVTSPAGVGLAAQFLRNLTVDWASADVTDEDLDGLAELMLRLIGSLMQYPASTPRSPDDVRAYVRRWLGPALTTASTRT